MTSLTLKTTETFFELNYYNDFTCYLELSIQVDKVIKKICCSIHPETKTCRAG